ncbi:LysE family translocator [Sabulicella glaciei]|uniref:Lysine transporter LysE n=1 Tax=Sabulicella glaciei TaxID=2984948 RepID=A0ABT3NXH8_9PROT|nr:lysine transporter LysE [Roseococcus sp. MDT2-1-1]MCW8086860.1 lysine transporter LysE [Roseococcus sp. MDT2-1-1]
MQDPLLFALAVLALLGTPGPTNTLLATAGAMAGLRASLKLILAEAAGYLIAILGIGLLIGPAVATSPLVSGALRVVVGAYLVLLAVRLWQRGEAGPGPGGAVSFAQVWLTTLLNPKALVLALVVIPFGHPGVGLYLLGFTTLLMMCALGWIAFGATLGAAAGRAGKARFVPRAGSLAVGGFAAFLLLSPMLR